MGKWSGGLLILAGVAIGGYALTPEQQITRETAAAHLGDGIAASASGSLAAPQVPAAPADAAEASPPGAPTAMLSPPVPIPAQRPRTATVRIQEAPPRIPVGDASNAAAAPLEGPTLIREIQRQLKRIGCYQGEATGVWTPAVRQSMRVLTERANASLPVDQPDQVLLAMVQGQAPGACSTACPAGQGRVADGRCVPAPLVAAESPKAPRPRPAASPQRPRPETPTAAYRPMDGQMSLAGPRPKVAQPEARHVASPAQRPARVQTRRSRAAYAPRRERRAARKQPYYGFSSLPVWPFPF